MKQGYICVYDVHEVNAKTREADERLSNKRQTEFYEAYTAYKERESEHALDPTLRVAVTNSSTRLSLHPYYQSMPGLLASRRNKPLVGSTKNGASLGIK